MDETMELHVVCYADNMDEHVISEAYLSKPRADMEMWALKDDPTILDAWVEVVDVVLDEEALKGAGYVKVE